MARPAVVTLELPIRLTNDNGGRTRHFAPAAKRRREYEAIIRARYGTRTPPDHEQHLTITRVLGKGERLYDHDSTLRGNAKELVDALVACGFARDDSPAWITGVDGRQDATQRQRGPCVLVCLEELPF